MFQPPKNSQATNSIAREEFRGNREKRGHLQSPLPTPAHNLGCLSIIWALKTCTQFQRYSYLDFCSLTQKLRRTGTWASATAVHFLEFIPKEQGHKSHVREAGFDHLMSGQNGSHTTGKRYTLVSSSENNGESPTTDLRRGSDLLESMFASCSPVSLHNHTQAGLILAHQALGHRPSSRHLQVPQKSRP